MEAVSLLLGACGKGGKAGKGRGRTNPSQQPSMRPGGMYGPLLRGCVTL